MGLPILKEPDRREQIVDELCDAFFSYCKNFLKIKDFEGKLIPFILNAPQQRFIRDSVTQWVYEGFIRVVIAKARKMGFSTVITAFIFWRLNINKGLGAIAGTHHDDTNSVLVDIFKRFHDNLPEEVKLTIDSSNASGQKYLNFKTEYYVCCASNAKKVGRGPTAQMIHVSEIAHIDNAGDLCDSLFNAVGGFVKDSMIFLESTANGMGNYHHELFVSAEKRELGCKYIAFFAAWYEDDRYFMELPSNFTLSEEEAKEKALYSLSDEQMCWRRSMIAQMSGTDSQKLAHFRQEYPSNSTEAFQFSAVDSFLEPAHVIEAMNRPLYGTGGAIIAGFDPSHKGKDRDAFIYRQDADLFGLETPHFGESFEARIRFLKEKLDNKVVYIDMLFMDAGGGGYELCSRLREDGYGKRVRYIEFGAGADNKLKYKYKRDEMFGDFQDMLIDKYRPLAIRVDNELKASFLQDLTATGYKLDNGKPRMETKEHMKSRGIDSTDLTDASILTVAQKIIRNHVSGNVKHHAVDETDIFNH